MRPRRALVKERSIGRMALESALANLDSHTPPRWTCRHHMDGSDITGFVMTTGGLETIAQAKQADGINARANAELIVRAVNNHDRYLPVINDLITALELC